MIALQGKEIDVAALQVEVESLEKPLAETRADMGRVKAFAKGGSS